MLRDPNGVSGGHALRQRQEELDHTLVLAEGVDHSALVEVAEQRGEDGYGSETDRSGWG
jgi:hypothetical protein